MIQLREVILSILEDNGTEVSLNPVRMPFAHGIFLALVIEREKGDLVLEFNSPSPNVISIRNQAKHLSGWTSRADYHSFNVADPEEFKDLQSYLMGNCHNRHVVAEFEDLGIHPGDWMKWAFPLVRDRVYEKGSVH